MAPTPDVCPHCKSKEIDFAGKCQVCGHKVKEDAPPAESARQDSALGAEGAINVEFSTPASGNDGEIPEWRVELSQRLLEIKRKRGDSVPAVATPPKKTLPFPQADQVSPVVVRAVVDAPLKPAPQRQSASSVTPAQDKIVRLPERNTARQQRGTKKTAVSLPLFQPARQKAGAAATPGETCLGSIPKVTDPDPVALQKLLDSIVIRQARPAIPPPRAGEARESAVERRGDKLVLLSRTLSGFVDLSIVALLASGIVLSADFFSGIELIDAVSKVWYAALLLATYLLYSAFFLGTANQTIGMMIKDLRVVGENGKRPKLKQVLVLGVAYLLSVFAGGLGLLWACFDRRTRCLHDRISHTRVVRL